jgi:hypothetical protein
MLRSVALLSLVFTLAACSSSSPAATTAPPAGDDGPPPPAPPPAGDDAGADAAPTTDACEKAPMASSCSVASSWVRGIVKFDPAHYAAGAAPILRVSLRHGFALFKGEEAIGGRLHAYDSVPVKDVSKGEIAFALDMCQLGTAMWSEENGTFNVVAILDENGNNDLDKATSNTDAITIGTPDKNELVKIMPVDVSCHAASACLAITADCKDGATCTTIQPITSCKKKTPGCKSDDSYCQ